MAATHIGGLLPDLLSADNARRISAEAQYHSLSPEVLFPGLLAIVANDRGPTGHLAAALLRQAIGTSSQSPFFRCPEDLRRAIRQQLIHCLGLDLPSVTGRLLAASVASLGSLLALTEWPDLLPTLLQTTRQCPSPAAHAATLGAIAELLPGLSDEWIVTHLAALLDCIAACLGGGVPLPSQIAAGEVLAALTQSLQSAPVLRMVAPLISRWMAVTEAAVSSPNRKEAVQCINVLQAMADAAPALLAEQWTTLGPALLTVLRALPSDHPVFQAATECLLTILAAASGTALDEDALKAYLTELIPQVLRPVLQAPDSQAFPEEEEDDSPQWDAVAGTVSRLADELDPDVLGPVVVQAVAQLWSAPHDAAVCRCAALLLLSETMEACSDFFQEGDFLVQRLLPGVLFPSLHDPTPRVRETALRCLARGATHCRHETCSAIACGVLPTVREWLTDPNDRVTAQGCLTFSRLLPSASMQAAGPTACALVPLLLEVVRHRSHPTAVANAWTALCAIVQCVPDAAPPHFPKLMAAVHTTLGAPNPRDRARQAGRARSMLCAAHWGAAVGLDRFRPDAFNLLQTFQTLSPHLREGDPQLIAMHRAQARIAAVIGPDCLSSLAPALQSLVTSIAYANSGVETSEDVSLLGRASEDVDVAVFRLCGQAERVVAIHTGMLDARCEDIETLMAYVDGLGTHLAPLLPAAVEVLIPLLTFKYHTRLRLSAAEALARMIPLLPGNSSSLAPLPDHLTGALAQEPVHGVRSALLVLLRISAVAGLPFPTSIWDPLARAMKAILEAQGAAHSECSAEDCTAEEAEDNEDDDKETTTPLADVLRTLLASQPTFARSYRTHLLPLAASLLRTSHCRGRALCLQALLPYLECGADATVGDGLPLARLLAAAMADPGPTCALASRCLAELPKAAVGQGDPGVHSVLPALMSVSPTIKTVLERPLKTPFEFEALTFATLTLVRMHRDGALVLVPSVADDLLGAIFAVIRRQVPFRHPPSHDRTRVAWREIHGYALTLLNRRDPIALTVDLPQCLLRPLENAPLLQPSR